MADKDNTQKSRRGRSATNDALALVLAAGATVRGAAEQLGVGERTVARRLADPQFRHQVNQARADLLTEASARLTGALTGAVESLIGLLGSEDERVRLQAAAKLLETSLRFHKETDLTERTTRLEITTAEPVQPEEFTDAQRMVALIELHRRCGVKQEDGEGGTLRDG